MARFLDVEAQGPSDSEDDAPRVAEGKREAKAEPEAPAEAKAEAEGEDVDVNVSDPSLKKKWRLHCKRLLLTYANAPRDWTKETLKADLLAMFAKEGLKASIIGRELHKSGEQHFHCAVELDKECDSENVRRCDIRGQHPNIRIVKRGENNWTAVCAYAMKDGDFDGGIQTLLKGPKDYRKRKHDLEDWARDLGNRRLMDVKWPLTLPDGTSVPKPVSPSEKKRHYYIWGPPDSGKTRWAQQQFEGQKVFFTTLSQTYAWDNYAGQEVIVCDDVDIPHRVHADLIACSNYCLNDVPLPQTRYKVYYWPLRQLRTIFILSNYYPSQDLLAGGWFEARFHIIQLKPGVSADRSESSLQGARERAGGERSAGDSSEAAEENKQHPPNPPMARHLGNRRPRPLQPVPTNSTSSGGFAPAYTAPWGLQFNNDD